MTTPDYAAIQARLDAATPGPWTATPMGSEGSIITAGGMTIRSARRVARVSEFADADAIVDVMNAAPALLAENQRLRDTIQAVEDHVSRWERWVEEEGRDARLGAVGVIAMLRAALGVSGE